MSVSLYEQETTISFRRVDDFATVWTSDTTVMTKLDRMCRESPENYKCTETGVAKLGGELLSKSYTIEDKGLMSFRARKVSREMTEEQKERMRENLRIGREKQKAAREVNENG